MNRLYLGLAALLVVTSAALWSCSSDSNDDDDAVDPTASSSGTPSDGASSETPSSDSSDASFDDALAKAKVKEAKVSYTFSTTGPDGAETSGTFTLTSKPPDSYRFDSDIGGTTGTFLSSGEGLVICSDSGGSGTCFTTQVGSSIPIPFINYFQNPDQLGDLVGVSTGDLDHSTKTIAGEDADCYSGSAEGGAGEVCFNSDGILLSITGGDSTGNNVTMEATSVEDTVDDSFLTPPYPIQQFPG